MLNRSAWLIAFIILSVIIAYYFIPDFSRNVIPLLKDLRYEWLFMVLMATLVHFFAEVSRWWVYLRKADGHNGILFGRLFSLFSITALVTYLLPAKLGIPVRVYLLTSRLKVRLATVTAYLVLDGIMAYGLWIFLGFAFYASYGGESLPIEQLYFLIVTAAVVMVLVLMFRLRLRVLAARLQERFALVSVSGLFVAIAILLLDIGGYILRHWAILEAMNVELTLPLIAYVTTVSIAAGFISMLPMGLGAYDVTLIFLLTTLGVPLDSAVLVPLFNRAVNMLVSIALGLPASYVAGESLFALGAKYRKQTGDTDV